MYQDYWVALTCASEQTIRMALYPNIEKMGLLGRPACVFAQYGVLLFSDFFILIPVNLLVDSGDLNQHARVQPICLIWAFA